MSKHLHAVQFDGITFGMEIETDTVAYRNFKKSVGIETVMHPLGFEQRIRTVPYLTLASIMRDAHWLVSARKLFDKITIDGYLDGGFIYVKYTNSFDFNKRT